MSLSSVQFCRISQLSVILCILLPRIRLAAMTPIVGGQCVEISAIPKYPFIVSLQDRYIMQNGSTVYRHFCGGTLITRYWILTAAHCVYQKDLTQMFAVIGYENINVDVSFQFRNSIDRMEFNHFHLFSLHNDIALLRLQNAARFDKNRIPSIATKQFGQLPKLGMKVNRKRPCQIVGYGATRYDGEIQDELIEGEVYVITNKQCNKILGRIWAPQPGDNTVCALGNAQDTCQGDSGGPLICSNNGDDYIYGIVSHGLKCGLPGVPSIFTVTIPYLEWITITINKNN